MRVMIIPALILGLSACSSEAPKKDEAVTTKPAAKSADGLSALPPGQYNVSVQVTKMDIPGLTDEEKAGIKEEIAQPVTDNTCLTADDLAPDATTPNTMTAVISVLLGDTAGEGCTFTNFSTAGGVISGGLSCTNSSFGALTGGAVKGTIGATETRYTVNGKLNDEDSGKPVDFAADTIMKRTGDCTG
jgi:Protein of unknown function (DUF3617)